MKKDNMQRSQEYPSLTDWIVGRTSKLPSRTVEMPSFESFFCCFSHLFISFLYLYQGTAQICNKWVPGKHLVWRWELRVWIWGSEVSLSAHIFGRRCSRIQSVWLPSRVCLCLVTKDIRAHQSRFCWKPRKFSVGTSISRSLPCTSSVLQRTSKNQRRKCLENRSVSSGCQPHLGLAPGSLAQQWTQKKHGFSLTSCDTHCVSLKHI